jgi:hypothetical protein
MYFALSYNFCRQSFSSLKAERPPQAAVDVSKYHALGTNEVDHEAETDVDGGSLLDLHMRKQYGPFISRLTETFS